MIFVKVFLIFIFTFNVSFSTEIDSIDLNKKDSSKEKIDINEVYEKVVSIKAFKSKFFLNNNSNKKYYEYEENDEIFSVGSGFFITENGLILTNSHVIENADKIVVSYKNKDYFASIVGYDSFSDIAIIEIKINQNLKTKYFELNKNISYGLGEDVYIVGNPYNLGISVSKGIISAKNRKIDGLSFSNLIQTDAVMNEGNSGGIMINEYGEAIGINSLMYLKNEYNTGIGFAIPIENISDIVDQIVRFGYIQYGWIGVRKCQNLTQKDLEIFGVKNSKNACIITAIDKNSSAEKAGLRVSDIIVSYDDNKFKNFDDFMFYVRNMSVGSKLTVNILRNDLFLKYNVTVEEYSDEVKQNSIKQKIKNNSVIFKGITFVELNKDINDFLNLEKDKEGMYVLDVKDDAKTKNIDIGDVLLTINQVQIKTKNTFIKTINFLQSNSIKKYFMLLEQKKCNNLILFED